MDQGSFLTSSTVSSSALPIKRFQRPRGMRLPWFNGHTIYTTFHPFFEALRTPFFMPLMVAPFALVNSLAFLHIQSGGNLPYFDCSYSGKFTFKGIDVPFGHLTFAQAKAIDLVWNTVVGRVLQTLMSIFAYKVFMKVLMRVAEREKVSYELFAALALSATRIGALSPLSKAVFSTLGTRARLSIIWLLLSTVYLALFPSLIDAVSGYQASRLTKLILSNGSTADLTHGLFNKDFQFNNPSISTDSVYITEILPRRRPSLENLGIKWQNSQQYFTAISSLYFASAFDAGHSNYGVEFGTSARLFVGESFLFGDNATFPDQSANFIYSVCDSHSTAQIWQVNITLDQYEYDADTGNFSSLPPPIGPIYTYADTSCADWFSILTTRLRGISTSLSEGPPLSPPDWLIYMNASFLSDPENYECVSQESYQWGFSYAWLLITSSTISVWVLGTWILWLDTELNCQMVRKGRKYGTWRAVLDLAESVNRDLGSDTCAYSEDEIVGALKEQNPVGYCVELKRDGVAHIRLSSEDNAGRPFKLDWDQEYGRKGV